MAVDFFDFYGIPKKFFIDEGSLKSKFLKKAKLNHPDYYVNNPTKYNEAMEQTSLNNQAFKILNKFDSRMEYILKNHGLLKESKNEIPQDFLLEMMDINEDIMDLQFEFDSEKIRDLKLKIQQIGEDLDFQIHILTSKYDKSDVSSSEETTSILVQIRNYYLKTKICVAITRKSR